MGFGLDIAVGFGKDVLFLANGVEESYKRMDWRNWIESALGISCRESSETRCSQQYKKLWGVGWRWDWYECCRWIWAPWVWRGEVGLDVMVRSKSERWVVRWSWVFWLWGKYMLKVALQIQEQEENPSADKYENGLCNFEYARQVVARAHVR